jgi:hypothetical protein
VEKEEREMEKREKFLMFDDGGYLFGNSPFRVSGYERLKSEIPLSLRQKYLKK